MDGLKECNYYETKLEEIFSRIEEVTNQPYLAKVFLTIYFNNEISFCRICEALKSDFDSKKKLLHSHKISLRLTNYEARMIDVLVNLACYEKSVYIFPNRDGNPISYGWMQRVWDKASGMCGVVHTIKEFKVDLQDERENSKLKA